MAILSLQVSALSQKREPTSLFQVIHNGKLAFIDKTGKIILQTEYDGTSPWGFSEGLMGISFLTDPADTGWPAKEGYIDLSGKLVIKPQFSSAYPFSNRFALVWTDHGAGFINHQGLMVISPNQSFEGTRSFSEGLATVAGHGKFGFIDKTGRLVIEQRFDEAGSFSEGLARVYVGDLSGYIDKTGSVIIQPRFQTSDNSNFSEGLAAVGVGEKMGFINRTGRVVIPAIFDAAYPFSEGLAHVTMNDKDGFVDKSGRLVIAPRYELAGDFSEGLAPVRIEGKYGYINQAGAFVIAPRFSFGSSFDGGLASVSEGDDKGGYIDSSGNYVWRNEPSRPCPCPGQTSKPYTRYGYTSRERDPLTELVYCCSPW